MEADAHFRTTLNISFGVPYWGALHQGISLRRDPVGEPEGGLFAWIFFLRKENVIYSFLGNSPASETPGNYPKRNKLHLQHGESLRTKENVYLVSFFGLRGH